MPAVIAPLPDLLLYVRAGCELCDEARATLQLLLAERTAAGEPSPRLVERDIGTDEALERALFDRIPVIELGDRRLELTSSRAKLRRLLAEVLDAAVPAIG
jgi:hypothetical protein